MNDKLLKLALEAGLLNYVDNETPRRYFVHGFADVEDVEQFAESIVRECISCVALVGLSNAEDEQVSLVVDKCIEQIKRRFGVK